MIARSRRHRAGESALREWKTQRRRVFRREWRIYTGLAGFIVGMVVVLPFIHGLVQLVLAGCLGATLMMLVVAWEVGGDVHSLSWRWGQFGEQETEDALKALDDRWRVLHDLPRERGNWDHVVVGPGGVFMLETKDYRAPAIVKDDKLHLGRFVLNGGTLRFSAKSLSEALQNSTSPWVQPVVVIWGEFAQQLHEENGIVYLSGSRLAEWIDEQPAKLSVSRVEELAASVEQLRGAK
jgi:hypothetical protein